MATIINVTNPYDNQNITYVETFNCPDPTHRALMCVYILIVSFLNCMLLYFIKSKTIANMKDYKMVLYSTTIIDFTSAWMQFLIGIRITLQNDMQMYNFDGILPGLVEGWEIFKLGRLHYLAVLETFFAAFSFAFGPIPFIYRYVVVCWNYKMKLYQFLTITFFIGLFAFGTAISYAIIGNEFYEQNSATIPMDPSCVRSLTSFTARQAHVNVFGIWNWVLLRGWFYGLCCICSFYSVIFYCGWRIQKYLGTQTSLFETSRAKSAQKQINITIWAQALCPMITVGFTLVFYWIATRTNKLKREAFILLFYSFMIFPILNPCISLSFIAAYRRSFYDFWRWVAGAPMLNGGWRGEQRVEPEVKQQRTTETH